jgi:hypothetical protein
MVQSYNTTPEMEDLGADLVSLGIKVECPGIKFVMT